MKTKMLYIPLDERPCNFDFPAELAKGTDVELVRPGRKLMGLKKRPGHVEALWEWLLAEAKDANGAILIRRPHAS
ncbi:DUF4127 family protein [Paenibacillus sp. DMB20]|uniref:DUF4127 family protein n=1 Tax=Paenibacillus sp. DMB20 TaxID=1642570 RepID=UPI00062805E4|nr:DUF4127 family protein [Paenibacillus sp. DMB20]KKO53866.1 hypothetical protein XI25_10475 [Paenibacillus sp. DMB20]